MPERKNKKLTSTLFRDAVPVLDLKAIASSNIALKKRSTATGVVGIASPDITRFHSLKLAFLKL